MSLAEQLLDLLVVPVQRTGLVSATQEVVRRPRHLMFDLVTEANEEPEVVCGIAINRDDFSLRHRCTPRSVVRFLTSSDQTSGAPLSPEVAVLTPFLR